MWPCQEYIEMRRKQGIYMCYSKEYFDMCYKRSSTKAKKLLRKAERQLFSLSFNSTPYQVEKFLKLRADYLRFVHGEDYVFAKVELDYGTP